MVARDASRSLGQTGRLGAIWRRPAVASLRGGISGGMASVVVDVPLAVREVGLSCERALPRPIRVHNDQRLVQADHIAAECTPQYGIQWRCLCFMRLVVGRVGLES